MKQLTLKQIAIDDLPEIGVQIFNKLSFGDDRGSLTVEFEGEVKAANQFISVKESQSRKGVARGLHFQSSPYFQKKLISVVDGTIYDFLLDMSDSDGTLYSFKFSQNDKVNILIPENFAHGFIATTDVRFRYTCFGKYNERFEETINVLPSAAKALGLGDILLSTKDSLFEPTVLI